MAQGSLELVLGPSQIEPLSFSETIVIGRDPASCHLTLEDGRISAVHCRIEMVGEAFTLVDLGSANSTFVNGDKVSKRPLASGDLIKLGSFVLMFNQLQGDAAKLPEPAKGAAAAAKQPVGRTVAPGMRQRAGSNVHEDTRRIIAEREAGAQPAFKEGKKFGRFEVIGEIGRGGMGVIYRVRDIKSKAGREYALKALPGGSFAGREVVERFKDEARALARIQQEGVVRIYKIDEENGAPYYVMDFIDGETLDARLERGQTYAPDEALKAIRSVAEIINGVHKTGLIHRDLTPSNIIFDKDGKTWLVDFGLARDLMVRERLTRTGELIGTPHYVSPEQAEGDLKAVDRRTDIYAMGAILYRLMTGTVPFDGESVPQIVMKVLLEEVSPPRRHNKEISLGAEAICLKALSKDREERYASAEELIADIDAYFEGKPLKAKQLTFANQAAKAAWKVRLALGAFALVLLFVLGLTLKYAQSIRTQQRAKQRRQQLFLEAADKLVEICKQPPARAEEMRYWGTWEAEMLKVNKAAGIEQLGWKMDRDVADATVSIGRLQRWRFALSLYRAAGDLGAEGAIEAEAKVIAALKESAKQELATARDYLARDRIEGAIFHARRCLEHYPYVEPGQAKRATTILANAKLGTMISAPGPDADRKLRTHIFPGRALQFDLSQPASRTPFQTRKAGSLMFSLRSGDERLWFALDLDKQVRKMQVLFDRRPRAADEDWIRVAAIEKASPTELRVTTGGFLDPVPVSKELAVLVFEQQGKVSSLEADPRSPALVSPADAATIAGALAARLPTEQQIHTLLRTDPPRGLPPAIAVRSGGAVVGRKIDDKRLEETDEPVALLLLIEGSKLIDHRKQLELADDVRQRFRAARAKDDKDYNAAIAKAVARIADGDMAAAGAVLEGLLDGWSSPPPFKALIAARSLARKRLRAVLAGVNGSDPNLASWLKALARGDQRQLTTLEPQVKPNHRAHLRKVFVFSGKRWYPSREFAQRDGALYYDKASGRWLDPSGAAEIGVIFAAQRWQRVSEASAAGLGVLDDEGSWIERDQALESGWAYDRARKRWRRIDAHWRNAALGRKIEDERFLVGCGVTADNHLVLLGYVLDGVRKRASVTIHAYPGGKPVRTFKVRRDALGMLLAGDTLVVLYRANVRCYSLTSGEQLGEIERTTGAPVALRPDGKQVAVANDGQNGWVGLFDPDGTAGDRYAKSGLTRLVAMAFSGKGGLVMMSDAGEVALVSDLGRKPSWQGQHRTGSPTAAAFLPPKDGMPAIAFTDGRRNQTNLRFCVAGDFSDHRAHRSKAQLLLPFRGGTHVLSIGNQVDRSFGIWSIHPPERLSKANLQPDALARTNAVAAGISRENDWIVMIGNDGKGRIWQPAE